MGLPGGSHRPQQGSACGDGTFSSDSTSTHPEVVVERHERMVLAYVSLGRIGFYNVYGAFFTDAHKVCLLNCPFNAVMLPVWSARIVCDCFCLWMRP